jgi:hypothetical protein
VEERGENKTGGRNRKQRGKRALTFKVPLSKKRAQHQLLGFVGREIRKRRERDKTWQTTHTSSRLSARLNSTIRFSYCDGDARSPVEPEPEGLFPPPPPPAPSAAAPPAPAVVDEVGGGRTLMSPTATIRRWSGEIAKSAIRIESGPKDSNLVPSAFCVLNNVSKVRYIE